MQTFVAKFVYKDKREVVITITEEDPYLGGRIKVDLDNSFAILDGKKFTYNSEELNRLGDYHYLSFYEC